MHLFAYVTIGYYYQFVSRLFKVCVCLLSSLLMFVFYLKKKHLFFLFFFFIRSLFYFEPGFLLYIIMFSNFFRVYHRSIYRTRETRRDDIVFFFLFTLNTEPI